MCVLALHMLISVAAIVALPGSGAPATPPPAAEPPSFSVAKLQMSGATGQDKSSASFYVLAGKDAIRGLHLLPGDLAVKDGPVIAANNYQVSPVMVATLEAGQAVLVTVTAGPAPASGTYQGAIRLLYQGIKPNARLELPVELKATAKTALELAPHPSPLVVRVTRSFLPRLGGKAGAESAQFSVRQKADGHGRVRVALTGPLDGGGTNAHGLPEGAVAVLPRTPPGPEVGAEFDLPPGLWTSFQVVLKSADLEPGTYRGAVELSGDWNSVQTLPLEVTVRDSWGLPLLVLLVGFSLSFVVTYMATTGSALLQTFRRIDSLQERLARPWLLASDDVADWQRRLRLLNEQASGLSQTQAQSLLNQIVKEIDEAQVVSEDQLKLIRDRRAALDQFGEQSLADPSLGALMTSPWVAGLADRLVALAAAIQDGSLTRGVVAARLKKVNDEVTLLGTLGATLPRAKDDVDVQAQKPGDWLNLVASPDDQELTALIEALEKKGLWPSTPQHVAELESAPGAGAGTGAGEARRRPPGWRERIVAWTRDPRKYLPVLSVLLSSLAVGLLVFTGLLTLYAGKPTFGSNWPVEYLGVFVWGLGSEAGRKQVGDLAPALGALRGRLGLTAPPA
ncbi:MAG: hypothetical protein ACHRXM_00485 [Isosphaerales bacterium]